MIASRKFHTPAAAIAFFNAPDNSHLRLVSVLPPTDTPNYTALYDDSPSPEDIVKETERLRLLEERIVSLQHAPADRKAAMNFPPSVIHSALVPLSIVSNRLGQLAVFRDMDKDERAEWIRENLDAVGCVLVPPSEAKAKHGCTAELVWVED